MSIGARISCSLEKKNGEDNESRDTALSSGSSYPVDFFIFVYYVQFVCTYMCVIPVHVTAHQNMNINVHFLA
jgi:steroid 5-alpha reductase family enzyme